jgi:metal-responsive CopG/Arc/MetJ family transcriptional regulator
VNFSVPDDVKDAFNRAYEGQNRSALIAELMREAVARKERREARRRALDRIARRRRTRKAVSESTLRKAREAGRP